MGDDHMKTWSVQDDHAIRDARGTLPQLQGHDANYTRPQPFESTPTRRSQTNVLDRVVPSTEAAARAYVVGSFARSALRPRPSTRRPANHQHTSQYRTSGGEAIVGPPGTGPAVQTGIMRQGPAQGNQDSKDIRQYRHRRSTHGDQRRTNTAIPSRTIARMIRESSLDGGEGKMKKSFEVIHEWLDGMGLGGANEAPLHPPDGLLDDWWSYGDV